jgi:hypothetical protein
LESIAVSWTVLKIPSTESGTVEEKQEIGSPLVDPKFEHTGLAGQIQFDQKALKNSSAISGWERIVAAAFDNRWYIPRGDSPSSR